MEYEMSTRRCSLHPEKCVEYFCVSHSQLACCVCISKEHKNCETIERKPVACKNTKSTNTFLEFENDLKSAVIKAKKVMFDAENSKKLVEEYNQEANDSIKKVRKEMNDALDKQEEELSQMALTIQQEQAATMEAIYRTCSTCLTEIHELARQIDILKSSQQSSDPTVAIETSNGRLKVLENRLTEMARNTEIRNCEFQPNRELLNMMKSSECIGKMSAEKSDAESSTDITVQSSSDSNNCWITGYAIMPKNQFAVIDRGNRKLKLVDGKHKKVISELTLPSSPWDVARITDNQVAVTLPEEQKIVVITTHPILAIAKEVKVDGKCWGIEYKEGKLLVTFSKSDYKKHRE